jgi:hypothetical protein
MVVTKGVFFALDRNHRFVHADSILTLSWFSWWLFAFSRVPFNLLLCFELFLRLLEQLVISLIQLLLRFETWLLQLA